MHKCNNKEAPEDTHCGTDGFVHLHVHDEYSTLDGVQHVDTYPLVVKDQLKQRAVAQTNHGNVAGSWAFFNSCRKAGVKPIIGMEAYYCMGDNSLREKDELDKAYYHLVLLALNNNGLHNLFKLSSYAFTEGMYYKPRINDALLADYGEDVLATSACLGSRSSQLIMRGEYKAAEAILDHHAAMFKDRFFIELQTHRGEEQKLVNEVLIAIASKKNFPLVLTADAHYTHKHEKQYHETTLRMATESAGDGFSFGDIECYMATHDDIWARAQASNIPYEAVSNTLHIANAVDDASYFSDRKNRWPAFKSLPAGVSSWQYLEAMALAGLHKRIGWPLPAEYEARVYEELRILKKLGMSDYMLIVAEYIAEAQKLGVLVGPGRGSAGGSIVAYAIGITELDPIRYGLIFARFVNEGRAGTPIIF